MKYPWILLLVCLAGCGPAEKAQGPVPKAVTMSGVTFYVDGNPPQDGLYTLDAVEEHGQVMVKNGCVEVVVGGQPYLPVFADQSLAEKAVATTSASSHEKNDPDANWSISGGPLNKQLIVGQSDAACSGAPYLVTGLSR